MIASEPLSLIPPTLRRSWPVAALAVAMACVYAFGLHRYLTLSEIAENRELLKSFVARHTVLAVVTYMAVYIAVVALSLPGAAFLSIAGGLLFGWALSSVITTLAATIGSIVVFEIVKTSFGSALAESAGPLAKRMIGGFAKDAFSYLLFLRLTPLFPFFAVNAVAGLANVKLSTFALATGLGIIPGSIAFAWLGNGLDSVIDAQLAAHAECIAKDGPEACSFDIEAASLLTPELLVAFVLLGLVALIPIVLKRLRKT